MEPVQVDLAELGRDTAMERVQEALGVNGVLAAFDVQAGCTGFNYALYVAERMVAPEGKFALVIGSDTNSRFTDWTDRTTCVLFGDGAGAVVLKPAPAGEGILQLQWRTDGSLADIIAMRQSLQERVIVGHKLDPVEICAELGQHIAHHVQARGADQQNAPSAQHPKPVA